jgi:hypothetical protein
MASALVASYCPNGPTFAVPRNWSHAVPLGGANPAGDQGDGRQAVKAETHLYRFLVTVLMQQRPRIQTTHILAYAFVRSLIVFRKPSGLL